MKELYIKKPINNIVSRRSYRRRVQEQFTREDDLFMNMDTPKCAIVIGLGGIGSHVADILGSFESMDTLILFDNDKVELSNLNRTSYDCTHIDSYKVEAMAESIARRNIKCKVIPICNLFNEETFNDMRINSRELISRIHSRYRSALHIFDCRDDDFQDHALMKDFSMHCNYGSTHVWRAAYNGGSITIDGHSEDHPCWGEPGYTVIPSHSLPSRLVALMSVLYACTWRNDSYELFQSNQPLTFDTESLIKHVHRSVMLQKLEKENPKAYGFMERFFKYYNDDPSFMKGKSLKYKILPSEKAKIENDMIKDIDKVDLDPLSIAPEIFGETENNTTTNIENEAGVNHIAHTGD